MPPPVQHSLGLAQCLAFGTGGGGGEGRDILVFPRKDHLTLDAAPIKDVGLAAAARPILLLLKRQGEGGVGWGGGGARCGGEVVVVGGGGGVELPPVSWRNCAEEFKIKKEKRKEKKLEPER